MLHIISAHFQSLSRLHGTEISHAHQFFLSGCQTHYRIPIVLILINNVIYITSDCFQENLLPHSVSLLIDKKAAK